MGRGKDTQAFLVGHSAGRFWLTNAGRDALLRHLNAGVPARYAIEPGDDLARKIILVADKRGGRVQKKFRTAHAKANAQRIVGSNVKLLTETAPYSHTARELLEVAGMMPNKLRRQLGRPQLETRIDPKGRSDHWSKAAGDMARKKARRGLLDELLEKTGGNGTALLKKDGTVVGVITCAVCDADVGAGGRKSAPAKCARCYQRERRGLPELARGDAVKLDASITVQLPKKLKAELERAARSLDESVSTFVLHLVQKAVRR